jgi:hypothetical protein
MSAVLEMRVHGRNEESGAGMRIRMEVKYSSAEVTAMVMAAHVATFGNPPDGMKWSAEFTYSGQFEVTAVDENETEADSE